MGKKEIASEVKSLDPLGVLIYYLCLTTALERGDLFLPSSREIADWLAEGARAVGQVQNVRVQQVWQDLQWINEQHILFHELPYDATEFFRVLAQHTVNDRIKDFPSGIQQITPRSRRFVLSKIVDKAVTALRLAALKDLYHFHHRDVSNKLFIDLALAQELAPDVDTCYTFIGGMSNIGYLENVPRRDDLVDRTANFNLEPTEKFRGMDMFVELRALDYFHDNGFAREDCRRERLKLRDAIRGFAEHRHATSG